MSVLIGTHSRGYCYIREQVIFLCVSKISVKYRNVVRLNLTGSYDSVAPRLRVSRLREAAAALGAVWLPNCQCVKEP